MKVRNRVSFNIRGRAKAYKKFQKLGIKMKGGGAGKIALLSYFDIDEDDPVWPEVKEIILSYNIPTMPNRIFTKKEIQSAEWVRVGPDFIHGYPMPDIDGSWMNISFNEGKDCPKCGMGIEQLAPIHLKREPKMGKRDFMGIHWTFNIFARPEVIEVMSKNKISGFETMPALHYKTKEPLNTVMQLRFTQELSKGLIDDNLKRELPECGHIKYLGPSHGMYKFHRDSLNGMPDFVRTSQWFGSGHLALRLILASSAFVDLYIKNKWRGLRLEPVDIMQQSEAHRILCIKKKKGKSFSEFCDSERIC